MDREAVDRALIPAASLAELTDQTRENIAASKSPHTVRAYRSDLADFEAWCAAYDRTALPSTPETVANYLSDLARGGRKASTVMRRLSAISQAHKMAGRDSPTDSQVVRMTSAGIRRGSRSPTASPPAGPADPH